MDRSKWEYKKLGEISFYPRKRFEKEFLSVGNYVGVENLLKDKKGRIDAEDLPANNASTIEYMPNDILIGNIRPYLRKIWLADKNGGASGDVIVVRINEDYREFLFPNYLYLVLSDNSFFDYNMAHSKGAKMPRGDKDAVLKYTIPIPSYEDQQRIVAELDCLNEMIAVKQEQLKEFDKLAQSIFYDMFGDPMVNDKRWEVSSYGKIFEIGSGGTPSKSITDYWEDGDIPWIGSNMCQNCFIYDNDGKFITQKGLKNSSAKVLKTGTILFALVGATIGKVGILKKEMATNQNIAFVNVWKSEDFDSIFVFFNSMKLYPLFMNLGNGGFKMANQSFIKDLPIICPPLSLQQQFAEKISAIEAQKELVKQSIAETQALLDYTMDYYFND